MRIPSSLAFLLGALLLSPALRAEDPSAPVPPGHPQIHKAKVDDLSRTLIDAWAAKTYCLTPLGVKKAACKANVTYAAMGSNMAANAVYSWNGKQGSLTWDNQQVGNLLGRHGWGVSTFDKPFKSEAWKESLKGASLAAKAGEKETVITVTGNTKENFKTLVFDKQGMLVRATADVDSPAGGKTELTIAWTYIKFGEKYAPASWKISLELPGMGKYVETTKLTYQKAGPYQVPKLAEASGSIGGNTTATKRIAFSDWKFNDDIK